MKILRECCCSALIVLSIAILTSASSITPRQTDEESLRNALDAVRRKQRSLDFSPRDYYNDLRNFKLHPNDDVNEDKFSRQENHQDLDDSDEDLEFLPLENGQLENIGGGYQNFNNKRLERALLDYFENSSGQRDTAPSLFRERERTGGHKRALGNDRLTSNNNDPDRDLAALLYKELQKGPSYAGNDMGEIDNRDYLLSDTLQSYYDRYLAEQAKLDRNKLYEHQSNSEPLSWGEIFSKQEQLRNRNGNKKFMSNDDDDEDDDEESLVNGNYGNRQGDRDSMYPLPAERRNVNGRYPLGREYGALLKRYPLTKRSPKPVHHDRESSGVITDPKVAKDLGALFGDRKTAESKDNNRTDDKLMLGSVKNDRHNHENDHDHSGHEHDHSEHEHDHSGHEHDHSGHEHDHYGHEHDHSGHEHDHSGHDNDHSENERDKPISSSGQRALEATTSESPKSFLTSPKATPGQKEIMNGGNSNKNNGRTGKLLSKRDHRSSEFTKKSVDWSQYFGIDRRKKKSALLARPDSQDQDDEWMLQRYYKTMAENMKSSEKDNADKDNGEKRDKLDQMDARLRNVKNLIVEDALKYGNEENSDSQEVKDVVMARLTAAYSLEKMRRALDEFRNNIAAQRDLMRAAAHAKTTNETMNSRDGSSGDDKNLKDNDKRSGHEIQNAETNSYGGRNYEGFDEGRGCPELDAIVHRCPRFSGLLSGVQELCIMHQICRACDDDGEEDCARIFAFGADKICEEMIGEDRRDCIHIVSKWAKQPSFMVVESCHSGPDSCLRRSYLYRHRGVYYENGWPSHLAHDTLQLAER